MAIKLNRIKRWMPFRDYLKTKWSIYVHFSYRHVNYYTAWLHTTKEDRNHIQSLGHPDLANSGLPKTMSASQARKKRSAPAVTRDHDDESSGAQAEKKARVEKTRERKAGGPPKPLSESVPGVQVVIKFRKYSPIGESVTKGTTRTRERAKSRG